MKKRKQTTKITIALLTILSLTLLMVGCGDTEPEAFSGNDEPQAVTEVTNVEAEEPTEVTSAETETEEPTEVATEAAEPETEEEIIANGYVVLVEGNPIVEEFPSQVDYGEDIEILDSGDKVGIIEEYYNEEEQLSYYRVCLENGKKGYVLKECIQLEE